MLWRLVYDMDVERWVRPRFVYMLGDPAELRDVDGRPGDTDEEQAGVSMRDDAYEELLYRLSQLAVEAVARWRHDPRQQPNRELITDPQVVEILYNVLRNPSYTPSIEVITRLMEEHAAQRVRQPDANGEQTTLDAKGQAEFAAWAQQWLSYIARTVSVPRQYVAVVHAMDGDWQQVQQDFQRVL